MTDDITMPEDEPDVQTDPADLPVETDVEPVETVSAPGN